ncbi:MAG: tyrosyl-tRNA synthetase [Thermoplasmata archaeon]|nr:tyrosyl-tRNA synthetase [Thermoplasmata archaeon]
MDPEAAYTSLRAVAQEAVSEAELKALCQEAATATTFGTPAPKAYIGFEPSGTAHVGWMVCTDAIRRLSAAGFEVTVLLADWHAQINDKLGGDLAAIQRCGKYMEEAFEALGIAPGSVTYRYANEFAKDPAYWAMVLKVAKHTTLARVRRAMTILGRAEDESDSDLSRFFYPAMQVADIFHLGIRLAVGGMDQRHAHMLARDVAPKLGQRAPVALHTPLVPGLKAGRMEAAEFLLANAILSKLVAAKPGVRLGAKGEPDFVFADGTGLELKRHLTDADRAGIAARFGMATKVMTPQEAGIEYGFSVDPDVENKMSKSDPDSGIFIHDTREDILRKLKAAHCPAKELDGNPVLDLLRLVVFPRIAAASGALRVNRPEKFGGNKAYASYPEVAADFAAGALHPMDLKAAVADALDQELAPVRAYFAKHPENWQFVQALRKTR